MKLKDLRNDMEKNMADFIASTSRGSRNYLLFQQMVHLRWDNTCQLVSWLGRLRSLRLFGEGKVFRYRVLGSVTVCSQVIQDEGELLG